VPELAKRGAYVRWLIRDANEGNAVLKDGTAEVAIGDPGHLLSIGAALKRVSSVFYVAPALVREEAEVNVGVF